MNQRGLTRTTITIIIAIIVIAIIGLVVYQSNKPASNQNNTATSTGGIVINDGTQPINDNSLQTLKSYRRTYVTGFEGDNVEVTYQLTYPSPAFSVTSENDVPSTIKIFEKSSNKSHTIQIMNNVAAGFSSSAEVYENAGGKSFCGNCTLASNDLNFKSGTDVKTWSNPEREVIVFKQAPGYIIVKLYHPTDEVQKILETLSLTSKKTTEDPTGMNNDTSAVTLFFLNESISPNQNDCTNVVEITRQIKKTSAPATAAINALLVGPTASEKADGYTTALPTGSKLNSIRIVNGVAYADFNNTTQSGGGSCSMAARTTQLKKTLLQFPTIKNVVLTVGGNSAEESFQP